MTIVQALADPKSRFNIKGVKYRVDQSEQVQEGDVVIDRKDGCHGVVDYIKGNFAAVRDGFVVEIAIPIQQLARLVPA